MLSSSGHRLLFSLLMLLLFAGSASPVYAIQFNAIWRYRESGGEGLPTQRDFSQRYSLGIGEALTYEPTHAIRASAAVGYTQSQRDSGDGFVSRHDLIPSAQLSLRNDIFLAQVSGSNSYSKSGSGETQERNLWDTSLSSTWNIPLWPSLALSYSEIEESETEKEKSTNFTLGWDLILAQFHYRYGTTQFESEAFLTETTNHSARFETGGKLWGNRGGFSFSQQFGKSTQDVDTKAQIGSVDFPLEGVLAASLVTDPVTGPDPEDIVLDSNPQLTDEDLDIVALVVDPGQRVSLGFSLVFAEDISVVHLSLDPLTTLTEAQALSLQWSLYVRDTFNTAWELEATNIPFIYDPVEKRFELLTNITESEIMVLAVNETGIPLDFTELQAFSVLEGDISSTATSYLTNAGINIRLTRTLTASTTLNLGHTETDLGEAADLETDRWTASGSLRWNPVQYFNSSLNFSENRYEQAENPEKISRVYSLNVNISPLPTLDVSIGTNLNERYSDEQKTRISTRYYLNTRALIYPDLKATWNISFQEDERLAVDEGRVITGDSISTRLSLDAELQRNLFADLTTDYSYRDSEDRTTRSGNATLGMRYRPSDFLALRGTYTTSFGDFARSDRLNLSLDLTLINTYKSRLIFNANHTRADTDASNLGVNWSWDISKYFTMRSTANYRIGDIHTYNFLGSLAMRL